MKVFVSSNCATQGYYKFCSLAFPKGDVRSAIQNQVATWVEGENEAFLQFLEDVDLVVAAPFVLGKISRFLKESVEVVEVPSFVFMGHRPDCFWLPGVRSPMGSGIIHSRIAASAFCCGVSEEQAVSLYSDVHFRKLRYVDSFNSSVDELTRSFMGVGVDISECLDNWLSTGDFMYTPNHPKSFVFFDILMKALGDRVFDGGLGKQDLLKKRDVFPDYLSKSVIWPVYDEIATGLGLHFYHSSWRTVDSEGGKREFGVREMLRRSYIEFGSTDNIKQRISDSLGGSVEIERYGLM